MYILNVSVFVLSIFVRKCDALSFSVATDRTSLPRQPTTSSGITPGDVSSNSNAQLWGMPSFLNGPAMNDFLCGDVPLICVPNAVSQSQVVEWRQDAQALASLAFGTSAGVASGQRGIRSGVHQVWLVSPGNPLQQDLVGNIDARKQLLRFVDNLRGVLDMGSPARSLPPELVELSYLIYDSSGAAYKKHVDTFADDSREARRCVSFILYLGDANDENDWDCDRDGGALRIHGRDFAQVTGQPICSNTEDEFWADITPQPGTIVLFDSASVPHEVMATKRGRICVVGWLGTYQSEHHAAIETEP